SITMPSKPPFDLFAALISHQLFERFPNLRIASIEMGSFWVPWLFQSMERIYGQEPSYFAEDPCETFRRHIWIAPFHEDDIGELRDLVGAENMVAGSDWPHAEGLADPTDYALDLKDLTDKEIRLRMRENALALPPRPPVRGRVMRRVRMPIFGAGRSGIVGEIKLREAGIPAFPVYEKASRLGGTWRENTYPGLGCDVPSHLYSYSFALNPGWSHRFSPGAEIQAYLERTAQERGVLPHFRFGDEVVRCTYERGRWRIETAGGHRDEVDIIIAATGVLHHPKIPHFEGIESFAGAAFHSARWDHSVPLDGRRVGVIGTGSTAVQITGALTERVAKFSLFQRTAQWVMPQENPAYSDDERAAFRGDPALLRGLHEDLSKLFAEGFASGLVDADSPAMQAIAAGCLKNLEDNVRDPELKERLRPNYRAACKRLVISPNFYEAIQRPNAELVTSAIERIEPRGVR